MMRTANGGFPQRGRRDRWGGRKILVGAGLAAGGAARQLSRPRRAFGNPAGGGEVDSGGRKRSTLSIVVPVMNEAECIEDTLAYLKLVRPVDIVVVDGGSTDGTPEKVRHLASSSAPRISLIRSRARQRARQMNEGAKAARGDCIMFVHADSLPPLDSVGLVGQAFSDPRVSLAAFKPIMDHRGRTMWGFSLLHHWKTHLGALFFRPVACIRGLKIFFGDQAMVARKDAFHAVGGFNEALNTMEDMDFCLRMFYGERGRYTQRRGIARGRECSGAGGKKGVTSVMGTRGKGRGDFSRFAYIDRVVHTSGRRVAEWGNLRSLQLFLVLSLRYALGASPSELNIVSNKVYTAIR